MRTAAMRAGEMAVPSDPSVVVVGGDDRSWRSSDKWLLWSLLASITLHVAGLAGFLITDPQAPPPPLPQIELLAAPAPEPISQPVPQAPSPSATVSPQPEKKTAVSPPPPAPLGHPLVAKSVKAATPEIAAPRKAPPPTAPAESSSEIAPEVSAPSAKAGTSTDPSTAVAPSMGPPPDYIGEIRARLEKVKRYPGEARSAGDEGVVLLTFVLDRSGEASGGRVEKGSGSDSLDEEARDMVRRASPFPPFPPSITQNRLRLVVPVEFSLKGPL